ncbi:MAG: patatin-like phospholipase family protein [Tetrasphaera sp.]|nr:patatin-like phospholipase family protein [Tetrasphaera sp.]
MDDLAHPVADLIRARAAAGSLPGQRIDGARLALVLEGGSSRAAYGGGMVCELEARGLLPVFDAVYGSSAGALNGAWFICGRARANVHGWWTPEVLAAVIEPRRALRGTPVVDTDVLVDHVYEDLTPMGFEEILASDVEYHPMATDTHSGDSVDLAPFVHDRASLKDALRATTRIPVLGGRPVEIAGRHFIDAGVTENVPVRTALAQGATHVLALRTQPPRAEPQPPSAFEHRLVQTWLVRNAPGAVTAWASRHDRLREEEHILAHDPRVLQVAPPRGTPAISIVGRSSETQRLAVAVGRAAVTTVLS